jgi:hypothetical protein
VSIGQQALQATLAGLTKFKALPGTGCVKHSGFHYSANRRCCECDAERKRILRAERKKRVALK